MTDDTIPRRLIRIVGKDLPKKHAQRMLVALARLDTRHLPKGRRGVRTLIERANLILVAEGWPERFKVDIGVMRRDERGCRRIWAGTRQLPEEAAKVAPPRAALVAGGAVPANILAELEALKAESRRKDEALAERDALIAATPVLNFRREHRLV